MDPEHSATEFARIVQELMSQQEEQPTLQRIVELAVETIPDCEYAGVSVRRGRGRVETSASTAPLVDTTDQLQYDLDEGPCLDTLRAEDTYVAEDLRTDERWPRWGPRVAQLGVRSILSVRLSSTDGSVLGGLNLYATTVRAFTPHDVDLARLYASHAAVALQASQSISGLQMALHSRHRIGMAQGMLMQRFGLREEAAFEVLVRYSQTSNTKLREVAERIVSGGGILQD